MAEPNKSGSAYVELENTTDDRILLVVTEERGPSKEPTVVDHLIMGIARDRIPLSGEEETRDLVRQPSPFLRISAEKWRKLGEANHEFVRWYVRNGRVRVHHGMDLVG